MNEEMTSGEHFACVYMPVIVFILGIILFSSQEELFLSILSSLLFTSGYTFLAFLIRDSLRERKRIIDNSKKR